jgi:KaiC/GvpD/RAD55 family RecA-like ATPase
VVDPVHPLLAGNCEEGQLRDDLRQLADTLETWGVTTILLNSVEATRSHPSFYPVFLENCSGVLELCDEIVSGESRFHLFVHKLRHWAGARRRISYELAPGLGLVERRERKQKTSAPVREIEELLGRGEE